MRSAFVVLSCLVALVIFRPVQAWADDSAEEATKLGSEAAMVAAWDFARCSVKRSRDDVRAIIDPKFGTKIWSEQDERIRSERMWKLAGRNGNCMRPGDTLKAPSRLFFDMLGGAMFLDKHRDSGLPDYSNVPPVFSVDAVKEAEVGRQRIGVVLRLFAECVFRLNPGGVRALLQSRPFSKDESDSLGELQPVMGTCVPAQEGAQLKLSKITVRQYLSMAAYLVDEAYDLSKQKKTSEMTLEQRRLYA